MCGFFGSINRKKKINKDIFNKIIDHISHRGPDDKGFYENNEIQLGFRRLSIIDIEKGTQPMMSANKKYIIVFNGEIYNFRELKNNLHESGIKLNTNSDTEVLLESFANFGIRYLKNINGMFAIALYNILERKLYLIRDRFGIKPLFFSKTNDHFIFGSEVKSLLNSNLIKKIPNLDAISSYLSFRYPYGTGTFFDSIDSVDSGEILKFEKGIISKFKYWDHPKIKPEFDKGESYYLEELSFTFNKVLKDHLISDVPIGCLLSGGVDSALLTALIANNLKYKFKTFSASFDNKDYDEIEYAKIVANKFNTEHININLDSNTYIDNLQKVIRHKMLPLYIPHEVALFNLFEKIKNYNKVVISGEGADEIFGGYGRVQGSGFDYDKTVFIKKYFPEFTHNLILKIFGHNESFSNFKDHFFNVYNWFPLNQKEKILSKDFLKKIHNDKKLHIFWEKEFAEIQNLYSNDKLLFIFQKHHLKCLLERLDLMSMAHGVEARVPFCDFRLSELMSKIPNKYKFMWKSNIHKLRALATTSSNYSEKYNINKYLLRKMASKILPEKISFKKKLGFPVPLNRWMSENFKKFAKEILLDKKSINRGLFNNQVVENLINHQEKIDYDFWGKKIWMLINIELWHREAIDNKW